MQYTNDFHIMSYFRNNESHKERWMYQLYLENKRLVVQKPEEKRNPKRLI